MSKITILLAEDHTLVREGIAELIKKENDLKIIGEVSDGRKAIDICRKEKPDIVIMDLAMPTLTGIEATNIIVKECPESKVIALTMFSEEEYIVKALKAGVVGYLIKKSASEDLINAIRAVAKGKAFFSPEVSQTALNIYREMEHKIGMDEEESNGKQLTTREKEVL